MAVPKRQYKHRVRKEALSFGLSLRRARRLRGFSLRGLAKIVGMSSTYLCQVEKGDRNPPPPSRIRELASHLNASERKLLKAAGYKKNVDKTPAKKFHTLDDKFQRVFADPLMPERLRPPAHVTPEMKQFIVGMHSALTNQSP